MAERILGPTGSKKRRRFLLTPVLLVAIVAIGALVTGGSVFAAPSTDASVAEYSQCANDKPPATTTACPQNWINGILNANNSGYHEDDTTAQRLILDLPRNGPTTNRKIYIKYLARKGQGGVGNHAYDSLGQWNYTQKTADRCQGVVGGCPGGTASNFTIPVDNTVVADSNGAGSSTALHELPDANRYMSMFGGTITNITAPVHDNASGSGDDYAQVVVTYSVTSTPTRVELMFGGHLAPAVGPRGWGNGVGASFINGGPYHIKLVQVDNSSVGNRDNQITAGAILPIGTEVQTALHQTDANGTDVSPANNQDPTTSTGISVTLPSDGTGVNVTDYATVLPTNATGTVAFRYYSTQAACTADTAFTGGVSAGSGKALDSNGVAKSDTKLITAAGVYYWRAHFTGTNLSVDSDSGCTHEILTANQATSTSTVLHQTTSAGADLASANNGASITVTLPSDGSGVYVKDYASILPASVNSGSVSFRYYTSSSACSADTNQTGGTDAGSGNVSSGSASSNTVHITSAGALYWRAFYGGDAANNINASSSACGDEVLTINQATSTSTVLHQTTSAGADLASPNNGASITVTLPSDGSGVYVKDYASVLPASVNSGTVTFRYYATSAACSADNSGTGGSDGGSGTVSSGSASGSTVHITTAGSLYWRAFYGGDASNNINASKSTCGDEVLTINQATSTSTVLHQTTSGGADLASPNNGASITVILPSDGTGAYVKDYASILPASVNSGAVTFRYYASLSDCSSDMSGFSAGSGNVSNGSASGSAVLFTGAGVWYWRAFYGGDAANNINASSSACGDEVLTVRQATSTSTVLHQTDSGGADLASPNNASSITVPVGAYVKDYASILPASVNSGSVSFRFYASSAACSADTNQTGGTGAGSGNVANGSASGDTVHFTVAGQYFWRAFYSGDATNHIDASSSTCGDEILTVQKASPTIASDPRLVPQDHATIAGILAGGSTQATITFTLWGPNNATCDPSDASHPALYTEQQNVNGSGTQSFTTNNSGDPSSTPAGFRLTSASATGVYHWSADYSGDEANNPNHRDCVEAFNFQGITDAAAG